MRLFLDSTSRVFRGQAPEGGSTLDDQLTTGALQMTVSDAAWTNTYYPAWLAAHQAGQDLVVAVDGSTTQVAHVATPREQAITILTTYLANPLPTGAETVVALKTLIRVVRALV